jgi:hypothetical protein
MDAILEAADALAAEAAEALAASSARKIKTAIAKKKKESAIVKIQRQLDELSKKMELVLSLLKEQKKQNEEPKKMKTRSIIKIASSIAKRTSRTSSSPLASPSPSPSSTLLTSKTMKIKNSEYYAKYPEIKNKFWGEGRGRRSKSILQKMDELIAQL